MEDDPNIFKLLQRLLTKEGYEVLSAGDGEEGLKQATQGIPDLIILDMMLPKLDGLSVLKELRREKTTALIPVLILSAKSEEIDRVVGLELGADDYVTKPFSPREVAARVKTLLRRADRVEIPAVAHAGYEELILDAAAHRTFYKNKEISLTDKEFRLLKLFLENPGKLLSRDRILSRVWGPDYSGGFRTVDVHVYHLRRKIPLLNNAIATVKSNGYRLEQKDS